MDDTPLVPPEAIALVRPELPALIDDIVAAAGSARPEYAAVFASPDGLALRLGIEQALQTFLEGVQHPGRLSEEARDVWRRLGRAEFQAGRSLEALQAAFRAGARTAVKGATRLTADAGVTASEVALLAEAIFVFLDELTSDVVDGYVRAQSDEAGERDRLRGQLAALLLDPEGHDAETIERAAARARWPLADTLAAVAVEVEAPARIASLMDVDTLAGADAEGSWLLVPTPGAPGRRATLERALGGRPAAVGPAVAPREAWRSLRWARKTLALVERGVLPAERPTVADDHLASLLVLQDDELARRFAAERLAPLDEVAGLHRERLLETLTAWLAHQRHTPTVAAELHVHPQTVRYRVGRLRELLGDALETPEGRYELTLALRARAGVSNASHGPGPRG
jgi:hypothetical protein